MGFLSTNIPNKPGTSSNFKMAASSEGFGEVLYRAGEDNSEDIWDDTALIEAYDRAVNIVKNGKWNSSGKGKGGGKTRKQQNAKRKEKQKSNQMDMIDQWQVGDCCCAVFSEDREIYEATIISIDRESKTCIVQYDDYGNEEEQNLKDLMESKKSEKLPEKGYYTVDSPYRAQEPSRDIPTDSFIQIPTFTDSYWKVSDICLAPEYPSGHWHEAVINSFPTQYTCQVTFIRSKRSQEVARSQLCHNRDSQHHPHGYQHQAFRPPGPWPPPPSTNEPMRTWRPSSGSRTISPSSPALRTRFPSLVTIFGGFFVFSSDKHPCIKSRRSKAMKQFLVAFKAVIPRSF